MTSTGEARGGMERSAPCSQDRRAERDGVRAWGRLNKKNDLSWSKAHDDRRCRCLHRHARTASATRRAWNHDLRARQSPAPSGVPSLADHAPSTAVFKPVDNYQEDELWKQ